MTEYLVVCRDEQHAGRLFESLVAHLRRNHTLIRAQRIGKIIQDLSSEMYRIRFMGKTRYCDVRDIFHGHVVWYTDVEKFLDTH